MAFNSLTELNLYSQGTLAFTNDVVTTIPEGTKVALPQPTWAWVRTTGNVLGNNLTFTHETIDTLNGNVTISFDDYNAATMNTNITTANGNVSITTMNTAEDWVGATLWLDVPADYYGNISFVSTVTNNDSNVSLQWNQTVVWENTPELDTPDNIQYNWYDTYASQWSIDFWVYNDTTAPTSSSISSYPVTMIKLGASAPDVEAYNWNEVLSYYDQDYIYEGFDQVIFDTRMVTASQYDSDSDGHPYFVMNNGPEFTVSADQSTDSGVSYRLLADDSNTLGTNIILRAGPGGGDPMPRGQWTHILMSFDPNLITEAPMSGGLDFYRNGSWTNQAGGRFEVGPRLVLGRDGIDHDKYFEGYIEDFRIRGRTYNEYYSGRIVTEEYSFTPPTTTTVASEGDVLLLNTPDDTNLTLDDNNYLDRDAVTITTKVGVSNYGNVTYKNTASIEFDGDNYIYIEDINILLNQGAEAGGATFMSPDSVPYVRDEEHSGTYTLNGQISTANLTLRVNSALSGASLDNLTGNETGNITMTGTRTDINAHLDTMYFERIGEVPTGSRTGNIVWTLTPPDSRAVTVINQQYSPIYNTNLTSQDRVIVPSSGLRQINTLAYAGVDANANPVFAYTVYDSGLLGGSLAVTSHKINYSTGNITYGSVNIIDLPDQADDGGGRLHLLGPRDGLNTGNTVNDGSDLIITATQYGGGNLFQGNVTLNTNNLNLDDYSISTVADSANDGTDYIYIAQIPQGVGNSWSEYPYTYTKYDHPVATFPRFDYTTADARQDYTTVYDLSTLNFSDDYSGYLVSPTEYYDWQPLDLWSDSEGGKLKAVQAKQVWTFGGGQDEVDMELRAFLGNQVEDDSDENTEYVTNITDVTTDTFFGLTGGNRGYRFNDTETDHYLKITNDDFYRLDVDAVTKSIEGTLIDGGDYLEFSGQKVTVTDNTLYVPQNDDFAITFEVNLQGNGPEGEAFLITNSNNTTIGADEFAITKYQDYISATNTWIRPRIRFYLEGTAYSATPSANQMISSNVLNLNTWYTFTVRRQSGVITMEQDGTTITGQSIENNTNLGTSSLKSWYIGNTGGGNSTGFWMRDLLWQVEGDNALRMEMDDVSFPIQTYLPNRDFLIEAFIKFYDNSADQWIISNLEDPSATLTASDFRVSLDDSTGQLLLETYNGSSTGGTVTYEEWYHLAVQRTQAEWEVFLNGVRVCNLTEYNPIGSSSQTTLYWGDATNTTNRLEASIDSLRVGSRARFETDGFIPPSSGASTSPVGAFLTAFNTLYPYPSRHWDTITIQDQLTASELTSIGYAPRYGSTYTFDRSYFGDCVSAFKLVYGGSDSRAYLIYTKSTYTDGTENFVETAPQTSVGLFYRKVTINDDLTLSLGGEIEIVNAATGPTYGRVIAADSVRLGSNMFINIIIGSGIDISKSYVYALKFSYS